MALGKMPPLNSLIRGVTKTIQLSLPDKCINTKLNYKIKFIKYTNAEIWKYEIVYYICVHGSNKDDKIRKGNKGKGGRYFDYKDAWGVYDCKGDS